MILRRVVRHRLRHLRIIDQPLDHVIAPRQPEWLDRALQSLVEPCHRPFQPPPEEPAHRGKQEMRGKGDRREQQDQHKGPKRKFHGLRHARSLTLHAPRHNWNRAPSAGAKVATQKVPQRGELTRLHNSSLHPHDETKLPKRDS